MNERAIYEFWSHGVFKGYRTLTVAFAERANDWATRKRYDVEFVRTYYMTEVAA